MITRDDISEFRLPLCVNVRYELSSDFLDKVTGETGCKIANVVELISNTMLQYWVDCPKEKEEIIVEYGFMTWIRNPVFQKYYKASEAFKKIAEEYNNVQS